MSEKNYYLGFSNFPGIGPIKFDKLIKHFGSAKAAWDADRSELEPILKQSLTKKFETFRKEFDIESYIKKLGKQKISFVCLFEDTYPKLLKQIPTPPIILFVKGNEKILKQVQNDNKILCVVFY